MSHPTRTFKNGLKFYQHHFSEYAREGDSHEPEEEEIFHSLISSLPENGCFVNIGASIGFYTLLAKRLSPALQVHGYEPLQQHLKFHQENIPLNGFQPTDFHLYEEGVSRDDGHVDYYENGFGSTIISKKTATFTQRLKQVRLKLRRWLTKTGIKKYPLSFTRIQVVSLSTVLQRCGGEIDLLQMDVQGSEGDILIGGIDLLNAGKVKRLLISTHGAPMHARCKSILTQAGYSTVHDNSQEKHDGLLICCHPSAEQPTYKMSA